MESCGRLFVGVEILLAIMRFVIRLVLIYKFGNGPRWVKVRNFGDQMLSLSESYSANKFSGLGFKGNCTYFTGESARVDMHEFVKLMGTYEFQDIVVSLQMMMGAFQHFVLKIQKKVCILQSGLSQTLGRDGARVYEEIVMHVFL